ncbi:MAG: endonuclease III [Ignavibacteriales bacterium]|nr:endonuclease III [Ignavibacteriales bacterium]
MPSKKTPASVDWGKAVQPLIKQYRGKKHPLEYANRYQLLVAVVLSAQDSDKHINSLAPAFFKEFPSMKALAKAKPQELHKLIGSVRNFANKSKWLLETAQTVGKDENIPATLEGLRELPGIGRKSANVILRESGLPAEGVIVDLHVLRVAPRLGIAEGTNPEKIEKQLMEKVPKKDWGDIGMAMSFLGREICRPTNPNCSACSMNKVCVYYASMKQ